MRLTPFASFALAFLGLASLARADLPAGAEAVTSFPTGISVNRAEALDKGVAYIKGICSDRGKDFGGIDEKSTKYYDLDGGAAAKVVGSCKDRPPAPPTPVVLPQPIVQTPVVPVPVAPPRPVVPAFESVVTNLPVPQAPYSILPGEGVAWLSDQLNSRGKTQSDSLDYTSSLTLRLDPDCSLHLWIESRDIHDGSSWRDALVIPLAQVDPSSMIHRLESRKDPLVSNYTVLLDTTGDVIKDEVDYGGGTRLEDFRSRGGFSISIPATERRLTERLAANLLWAVNECRMNGVLPILPAEIEAASSGRVDHDAGSKTVSGSASREGVSGGTEPARRGNTQNPAR